MCIQDLGSYVLVAECPLVEVVWNRDTDAGESDVAELQDGILGQAKGRLGIAGKLVVTPSCRVAAGFVEEVRRKDVIPDDRESVVDLGVIEELIAESAVVGGGGVRGPIDGEAGVVLGGNVGVEASVVLLEIAAGWVAQTIVGDVGNVR